MRGHVRDFMPYYRRNHYRERRLSEIVSRRNNSRTVDGYTQIVRQHLTPHLSRYQLDHLRPEHVQAMLNTLAAEGRKYNTVRNIRAVLRRALNQALRWQHIQRNVATLVDVPRYKATDNEDKISTTMNTYAHVLPRLQRDATTKIEELLDASDEEPPLDAAD
jgi:hypothetical protein